MSSTQGMFDFGHENTIAANLRQRHIENMVATGANLLNGYLYVGPVLLQPRDHFVCLDHRQLAGSCPYRYALHQFVLPNQTSIVRLQRTHAPGLPPQLPSGGGWVYAIAYLPAGLSILEWRRLRVQKARKSVAAWYATVPAAAMLQRAGAVR